MTIGLTSLLALSGLPVRAQAPPPASKTPPLATTTASTTAPAKGGALPLFPLRLRWSADLEAAPVGGIATDNTRVFVPLSNGALLAVEAATGAAVWRADLETSLKPVSADGMVYVVAGQTLRALDAATGRPAWQVPLAAEVSAPLVARAGWVIAALKSGDVLAVRGTDGTEVWRQTLAAAVVAPPAINGDRLYLPGADGVVRTLAIDTGVTLWTRPLGGSILSIAPLGSRVYVGSSDNHFYCLDDNAGRVRWRWRVGADPIGTAMADDERVYFTSLDTVLRALDRGHGAQRWRQPLPWRPRTGPVRVGNTLVAVGIAVDLRGYALDTGKAVGEYALTENRLEVLEGAPVVVERAALPGNFLVAAIADGRLVALEHVFGLPAKPLTDLPGTRVAITAPPPS